MELIDLMDVWIYYFGFVKDIGRYLQEDWTLVKLMILVMSWKKGFQERLKQILDLK